MTQETFLEELQGILRTDVPLSIDYPLDELDEWDSMSILSLIVYFDEECGKNISGEEIKDFEIVKDIMDLM